MMDESSVWQWYHNFNEGRENVLDEERTGCPSVITHDLLQKVDKFIKQDRRIILIEISKKFSFDSTVLSMKLSLFA